MMKWEGGSGIESSAFEGGSGIESSAFAHVMVCLALSCGWHYTPDKATEKRRERDERVTERGGSC